MKTVLLVYCDGRTLTNEVDDDLYLAPQIEQMDLAGDGSCLTRTFRQTIPNVYEEIPGSITLDFLEDAEGKPVGGREFLRRLRDHQPGPEGSA